MLYYGDNLAITLTKNPFFHGRSKHIRIKYHFIRDLVQDGEVIVKHCKSQDQAADVFTKALKAQNFNMMKANLGVLKV